MLLSPHFLNFDSRSVNANEQKIYSAYVPVQLIYLFSYADLDLN